MKQDLMRDAPQIRIGVELVAIGATHQMRAGAWVARVLSQTNFRINFRNELLRVANRLNFRTHLLAIVAAQHIGLSAALDFYAEFEAGLADHVAESSGYVLGKPVLRHSDGDGAFVAGLA